MRHGIRTIIYPHHGHRSRPDAGAEVRQAVKDVGGGKLIASARDAHGNIIGLLQSP